MIDEKVMRSYSRQERRALRELLGKCASCAWPANTICSRNCCPQGIASVIGDYRRTLAELERTCHTSEDWFAAGEGLLRKAELASASIGKK